MSSNTRGDVDAVVDVVVVGAGLAGATAARELAEGGLRVRVLDKGRGLWGCVTMRRPPGSTPYWSAAALQADDPSFVAWLEAQRAAGRAALTVPGWVGVPGMNALVASLLEGLDVHWSTTVTALESAEGAWCVRDESGAALASARGVIIAIPAPQACALLGTLAGGMEADVQSLVHRLAAVRYAPCWAGLLAVDDDGAARAAPFDAVDGLEAIVREADKPGRVGLGHWVVHASAAWSDAHLELAAVDIATKLAAMLAAAIGIEPGRIRSASAHRWRYARPTGGVEAEAADGIEGLAIAGDAVGWRPGGHAAEQAWRSGRTAALRVMGMLSRSASRG